MPGKEAWRAAGGDSEPVRPAKQSRLPAHEVDRLADNLEIDEHEFGDLTAALDSVAGEPVSAERTESYNPTPLDASLSYENYDEEGNVFFALTIALLFTSSLVFLLLALLFSGAFAMWSLIFSMVLMTYLAILIGRAV